MKKVILGIVLLALLFYMPVYAQTFVNSSGTKAATASIYKGEGNFHGIALATDGTNAVTVSIYDNLAAASGTLLVPTFIATTSATDRTKSFVMSPPVHFNDGLYVEITCSGTVGYVVYYSR